MKWYAFSNSTPIGVYPSDQAALGVLARQWGILHRSGSGIYTTREDAEREALTLARYDVALLIAPSHVAYLDDMMPGPRYFSATYLTGNRNDVVIGPLFVSTYDDEVFWLDDGPARIPVSKACITFLQSYGSDRASAETAFYKSLLPQPCKPRRIPAWVSPQGDFYPCQGGEHNATAMQLAIGLGIGRNADALERTGWVRFYYAGSILPRENVLTEEQFAIFRKLRRSIRDTDVKEIMGLFLDRPPKPQRIVVAAAPSLS